MNPFEAPPSTPPVSLEPPDPPAPRRGRMALVALASAGLLAGGVVGVSALVSADDPELEASNGSPEAGIVPAVAAGDGEETGDGTGDDDGAPDDPFIDGEIIIDLGGDEPLVIDLGDLAGLDEAQLAQLEECTGIPLWLDEAPALDLPFEPGEFEGDLDEMFGMFEEMLGEWAGEGELFDAPFFDEGFVIDDEFAAGEITVMGPDGLTVIDLGDGDASVTISRDGETGELTITTDGTASEQSLDDLFGELELPESLENLDLGELDLSELLPEGLDEFFGELPGEFGAFEIDEIDPQQIADCLADLG